MWCRARNHAGRLRLAALGFYGVCNPRVPGDPGSEEFRERDPLGAFLNSLPCKPRAAKDIRCWIGYLRGELDRRAITCLFVSPSCMAIGCLLICILKNLALMIRYVYHQNSNTGVYAMAYLLYLHICFMASAVALAIPAFAIVREEGNRLVRPSPQNDTLAILSALLGFIAEFIFKTAMHYPHLKSPHVFAGGSQYLPLRDRRGAFQNLKIAEAVTVVYPMNTGERR